MKYRYLKFRFLYHGTLSSLAMRVTMGSEVSVSLVAGVKNFMITILSKMKKQLNKVEDVKETFRGNPTVLVLSRSWSGREKRQRAHGHPQTQPLATDNMPASHDFTKTNEILVTEGLNAVRPHPAPRVISAKGLEPR